VINFVKLILLIDLESIHFNANPLNYAFSVCSDSSLWVQF